MVAAGLTKLVVNEKDEVEQKASRLSTDFESGLPTNSLRRERRCTKSQHACHSRTSRPLHLMLSTSIGRVLRGAVSISFNALARHRVYHGTSFVAHFLMKMHIKQMLMVESGSP